MVAYLTAAPEHDPGVGADRRARRSFLLGHARPHGGGDGQAAAPEDPRAGADASLSSLWIGLVTPVDAGVARPLVEGLSTETVVKDPSAARAFDIDPIGIDEALKRALAEEDGAEAAQVP